MPISSVYAFACASAALLTILTIFGLTPLLVRYVTTYVAQRRWPMLRGWIGLESIVQFEEGLRYIETAPPSQPVTEPS